MMIELTEQSNYAETEQSVRNLPTLAAAQSIRDLTERGLTRGEHEDYILRISERPDGLFDLIVLKRVN